MAVPEYITKNLGGWVRVNSGGNDSQIGRLESFTFEDGFTLRPALIGDSVVLENGKTKPRYYLEEDRLVGIGPNYTSIVPLRYDRIQELLKLNKEERLNKDKEENNQLELF